MFFNKIEISDNSLFLNRRQPDLILAPTSIRGAVGRLTLHSIYSPQVSFYLTRDKLEELRNALNTILENCHE